MQEENVYLKFLAVEEQIATTVGIMVRIPQNLNAVSLESRYLDVVVFQSWNPDVVGHWFSAEF